MSPRPDTSVTKKCSKCKSSKPPSEFHKNRSTFDGLQTVCKSCARATHMKWLETNAAKNAENAKKWRAANPRLSKDFGLRHRYGIPLGTYDRMFAEQNGKCAICETTDPGGRGDFHIDHCHDTGVIRGLLCHNCNVGIGHFQHDEVLIQQAINYVTTRRS